MSASTGFSELGECGLRHMVASQSAADVRNRPMNGLIRVRIIFSTPPAAV